MKVFQPHGVERKLLLKSIDAVTSEIRQRVGELQEQSPSALESKRVARSETLYRRVERIKRVTKQRQGLAEPTTGRIYSLLHRKWVALPYDARIREISSRCDATKIQVVKLIDRLKTYWHGSNLNFPGNDDATNQVLWTNCLSIDDWERTLRYFGNFRHQLEQPGNEAQRDVDSDFKHSPDYRTVNLRGKEFTLTPQQAKVIEILHRERTRGTPNLSQAYILEEIEGGTRLLDTFKSNMEAYTALIGKGPKRTYHLNI
ncbi:MAG: hypothetical protein L0387_30450 [Acidobacteria bacterium]|nr:hypothetical protein [Acidobacteriota bacterium]